MGRNNTKNAVPPIGYDALLHTSLFPLDKAFIVTLSNQLPNYLL